MQSKMPKRKHGLTSREVEILQALSQGKTRAQVADELEISAHTLNTHVSRTFKYLDAMNLVEAVQKQADATVTTPTNPGSTKLAARIGIN